jgi:YidC/Oxa1 family membrane protein insertase
MSSNQRLFLALGLSFVFFIAYTAIFPPPVQELTENNNTTSITQQENTTQTSSINHTVNVDERRVTSSNLVSITSEKFTLSIDTLGRISSKVLQETKYSVDDVLSQMVSPQGTKPLFIRFSDDTLNALAMQTPYKASVSTLNLANGAQSVTLTQQLNDLVVTKNLTFYSDGHYDVDVSLSEYKRYFIYLGQRPEVGGEQMMTVNGSMVYDAKDMTTIFEDGDVEGRNSFSDVKLVSAFNQYFATIFYGMKPDTTIMIERDRDDNPIAYLEGEAKSSFNGYIGPKDYKILQNIDTVLVNAIEYGWFTFASAPLFKFLMWLHSLLGNWGWAIVALTLVIRLLMYPLTYKGMVSMQKLKEVAPKVKELQAKYKGDPQRMNAAVMDLYKKNGANPLGGCLPLLLQIPVFFAIYRVLLNAVELQGAEWILWIDDLSKMDSFFVLPILMGATMYYQQRITPSNFTDPMQEKVFRFLPIIFTFFFITFPSGLVLYWFINNLFSIAQQFFVNKKFESIKAERHEKHLAEKSHSDQKDTKQSNEN